MNKAGCGDAEAESKQHDLAEDKLQRAKDKWNEDRMERLDFISQKLRQKNEAKSYTSNVYEAMFEHC